MASVDFSNIGQKIKDFMPRFGKAALKGRTDVEPSISYEKPYSMNPSGLYGSVFKDRRGHLVLKICLAAGLALGLGVLFWGYKEAQQSLNKPKEVPACILDLNNPVNRNIPMLTTLYTMSDESIIEYVSAGQETIYKINVSSKAMEIMRVAPEMTVQEMATCYAEGFSNQELETMCTILKNSWWVTTNHGKHDTLKLKYSEFVSKDLNKAILNAMKEQGLTGEGCVVLASGVDGNGNTYKYGTLETENGTLYWRVAACPVKDVYGFESLPDDGVYVGITLDNQSFMEVGEPELPTVDGVIEGERQDLPQN